MSKVSFNNTHSPFFKTLKTRVNNYFIENNLSRSGGLKLFFKGALLAASALSLYICLVFFTPSISLSIILCGLLGFNFAAIGFNIMHEGAHGSFSKYKWLNEVCAYSLNILGGTSYFWKQKHNIEHHTYTNIEGMDHDIDVKFMRIHHGQPKYRYHKFQQYYWVLLYGISYMAWVMYQDFAKYFIGKNNITGKPLNLELREHIIFWLTKAAYLTIFIVLPAIMIGWIQAILGFIVAALVCGFSISIVFQLAHVVEGTVFTKPSSQAHKIEKEWAIHQINTTANFATRNKVISWFLGGLNFQVEHHLFPGISHVHYPQINKLVQETCKEFNVAYLEYNTMARAFYSHLMHIKKLGTV